MSQTILPRRQNEKGKNKTYCILLNKKARRSHCGLIVRIIVRFHCALHWRAMGVVRRHSVHNGAPPSLRNEVAQCNIIVRPAWHNGRAYISEAKSAWHNDFVIVRLFFDRYFFKYNTVTVLIWANCNQVIRAFLKEVYKETTGGGT